ncbi:MAG: Npun_F0494 family protein [Cyanobacteriota bacterium]|jgi:hypothetical protein
MPNNIEQKSLLRAEYSMTCLPFKRAFYEDIDRASISAEELCQCQDWQRLTFVHFGPKRAEEYFDWMIKLGILRREVDGQGLTSRVRLTPMGRKIISRSKYEIRRAALVERIFNALRHYRIRL